MIDPILDLALAAIVFWAIQAVCSRPGPLCPDLRAILRQAGTVTDLCHWFANTIAFAPLWGVLIAFALAPLAAGSGSDGWLRATVAGLPRAAQFVLALVAFDLAAYWRHRLMHSDLLWPVHAVHHSSTHLNWLSGVRNHPLNTLVIRLVGAATAVGCGFAPDIVAVVGVIRFYWVCFLHTDIRLDLGPLNYVIATPDFHRWHHVPDGIRHRNYSGFFSLIDLAFGTFHLPRDVRASTFGLDDPAYPRHYPGQFLAPFRTWRASLRRAATMTPTER